MSDTSNGVLPPKCESVLEVDAVWVRAQATIQW